MTGSVTIPLWLFVLLAAIFILALLDHVLVPSLRWFFRRKINRVIDEISSKLDLEIRPFQLTKRQLLIDRLRYDPIVMEAVRREAREKGIPRENLQKEVHTYAKEIVPAFNAYIYFRIGYWIAKKIARMLYRVRIGMVEDARLESIDPDSTVVFVMNHRSNMDYILVSFLVAEKTALSYAVGEWAKIWPLQTLIRAMGAFFVRRDSGNPLYRLVLKRYIHMATKEGVCQAVFPEGGLSRDGLMREPKFGLLDYVVQGYDPERDRDIVFIPVGINYDRTLEDRSLLRAIDPTAEKRSSWFVIRTTVRFLVKSVFLMMFSRWQRFGYACVNFGPPLSLKQFCRERGVRPHLLSREERFEMVVTLCRGLMATVRSVIPVLPVPLVAAVFTENSEADLSAFEVEDLVNRMIEDIEAKGAPVYTSTRSRVQNMVTALNMLRTRRLLSESDQGYRADPGAMEVLAYYANSVAHWRQH